MLWSVHSLQLLKVFSGVADVDQRSCRGWDGKGTGEIKKKNEKKLKGM